MPKVFRARRMMGALEKGDETGGAAGRNMQSCYSQGKHKEGPSGTNMEPLSQISLKGGIHRGASKAGCYQRYAVLQPLCSHTLP